MFDFLFRSIPKIIFEPLAITMMIWIVCALFLCKKKNKFRFWLCGGGVFFMIAWRTAFFSLMASARYASILIFPCVIFSACLCMKTQPFFFWIFKKLHLQFPYRRQICKFLPVVLFCSMIFAGIGKSIHIDPYGDFILKISEAYKKQATGNAKVYITNQEVNRLSWYLGLKNNEVQEFYVPHKTPSFPVVKKKVEDLKNIPGDHYFFFYQKKGEIEPSESTMQFDRDRGTWEILARYYTSRRKNSEIVLARYRPVCPDIKEWNTRIPPVPKGNFCHYGDFETVLTGNLLKNVKKSYLKNQVKGYLDLSDRKLPHGWLLSLGSWNNNNPPDFRLQENSALAGKYSLAVDARPPRGQAVFNYWYYLGKPCKVSLLVRGEGTQISRVHIRYVSRNLKINKYKSSTLGIFEIHPGKVYRLDGEIRCDQFESGWRNYCFLIIVNGFVSIDQICFVPLEKTTEENRVRKK